MSNMTGNKRGVSLLKTAVHVLSSKDYVSAFKIGVIPKVNGLVKYSSSDATKGSIKERKANRNKRKNSR